MDCCRVQKKLINFLYLEKFYVTKMEGVMTKILNRTYLPLFEISNHCSKKLAFLNEKYRHWQDCEHGTKLYTFKTRNKLVIFWDKKPSRVRIKITTSDIKTLPELVTSKEIVMYQLVVL